MCLECNIIPLRSVDCPFVIDPSVVLPLGRDLFPYRSVSPTPLHPVRPTKHNTSYQSLVEWLFYSKLLLWVLTSRVPLVRLGDPYRSRFRDLTLARHAQVPSRHKFHVQVLLDTPPLSHSYLLHSPPRLSVGAGLCFPERLLTF